MKIHRLLLALLVAAPLAGCVTIEVYPNGAPPALDEEAPAVSQPQADEPEAQAALPSNTGETIEFYFTDPENPQADDERGGPDEALVAAFDQAQTQIDVAIYNMNLKSVAQALIRAHQRGVKVRVVAESDSLDNDAFGGLMDAGIEVRGDERDGLMHNKFAVIDGQEVWAGTMNWTRTGAYTDHNVVVRLVSQEMAENYTANFEDMFVAGNFGSDDLNVTPHPRLTIAETPVEVYFSPRGGAAARVTELLRQADEEIEILTFTFTRDDFAEAIENRAARGVTVRAVFEADNIDDSGSEYEAFKDAGYDVRRDGDPGQMHYKMILIDDETVVLGSFNFTASAEKNNNENLLVLHSAELTQQLQTEFDRIYAEAIP